MATGNRRRYDLSEGTLDPTTGALSSVDTTITFESDPGFATLAAGEYLALTINEVEIVHLTDYTATDTTGTIERGQEGTTAVAHNAGDPWVHAPTALDHDQPQFDDGTAAAPTLTLHSSPTSGLFAPAADSLGVSLLGVERLRVQGNQTKLPDGVVSAPSLTFLGDATSGVLRDGSGRVVVSVSGTEVLRVGSSSVLTTTPVLVPDGTVANPTYSFDADPDTGFFRQGVNVIGVAGGGTTGALIASNFFRVSDGTQALPALSFIDDSDTGFYRPTGGVIVASCNNVEALRIAPTAVVVGDGLEFRVPDGTAADPAVNFKNDLDTGLYLKGTNQLSVSAGNAESATFSAAGVTVPSGNDFIVNTYEVGKVKTDWTPTLTASTTNPTRQNGTGGSIVGAYMVVNQMCTVWVRIVFGSTGASGAGVLICDLPLNADVSIAAIVGSTSAGSGTSLGTWHVRDSSGVANNESGGVMLRGADAVAFALSSGAQFQPGTNLNDNGDVFTFQLTYPIA